MRKSLFLVLLALVLAVTGCSNKAGSFGYVSIRINPKIDLLIDGSQNVDHFIVLNEEAEILLAGEDLNGMSVLSAIEKILDLSIETGYIDVFSKDNVVAVFATDTKDSDLQDQVESHIQTYLSAKAVAAAVIAQTAVDASIQALGDAHDVSNLQAKMIQTYLGLNPKTTESSAVGYSLKELHELLSELFDEGMDLFREQREAAALTKKNAFVDDLESVLDLFFESVAAGVLTLPDLTGLNEKFLADYSAELAKILARNQERIDFLAAKASGSMESYLVGEFEFAVSSQGWPHTVNHYHIEFQENGIYFESWSITSKFDGQTSTSDYIGSWQIEDGRLLLSGSPMFRFYVSNGSIYAYDEDGEQILFHKVE